MVVQSAPGSRPQIMHVANMQVQNPPSARAQNTHRAYTTAGRPRSFGRTPIVYHARARLQRVYFPAAGLARLSALSPHPYTLLHTSDATRVFWANYPHEGPQARRVPTPPHQGRRWSLSVNFLATHIGTLRSHLSLYSLGQTRLLDPVVLGSHCLHSPNLYTFFSKYQFARLGLLNQTPFSLHHFPLVQGFSHHSFQALQFSITEPPVLCRLARPATSPRWFSSLLEAPQHVRSPHVPGQ